MIVITTTVINQIVPLSGVLGMLIKPATAQLIAFVMKTIITIQFQNPTVIGSVRQYSSSILYDCVQYIEILVENNF